MFSYTEKKLSNQVMKAILAQRPDCRATHLEDQSMIFVPALTSEDQSSTVNLANLYEQLKYLNKKERNQRIKELVNITLSPPQLSSDERMANLRLRARTMEEIVFRQHDPITKTKLAPTVYGNEGMVLELVEDSNTHVLLATENQLKKLDLSANQAYKMAAAAHHRGTDAIQWQAIGDVWLSNYQDDYDFSRLLVTGSKTRFPFAAKADEGTVIAYAPSHAVCLITDKQDANALQQLVSIGDQLSTNHRALSKNLWTLNDAGHWVLYKLAIDQQAAHIIKIQEIRENTMTYTDQQRYLERRQTQGQSIKDEHVASYVGFQTESGAIFSNTNYTLNQSTLLPKTDIVSIYDDELEAVIGMLNWKDFASILNDELIVLSDLLPIRFSVKEFLSENTINKLRRCVLPDDTQQAA